MAAAQRPNAVGFAWCNETRNVFGMMPHPENSVEAELAGGADGRVFFGSMIDALRGAEVTA